MKKIITSALLIAFSFTLGLSVLAEEATSTATTTTATVTVTQNYTCVATAAEKRDNAMIAAVDAQKTAYLNALTKRRDALKAGWVLTDKKARKNAVTAAWKTYSADIAKAQRAFKNAKRAAWKQFYTDRKACKNVEANSENESADNSL